MKANMSYQKKRTLIIIAIIAALAIVATIGTVVYVRGNRRAAAATPEEVSNVGTPSTTNNGNDGSSPTQLPQLGEEQNNPAVNSGDTMTPASGENTGDTTTNNGTGRTTTNTNGGSTNVPNGQYTQTTVIPGGGDTVLVAETDARSWRPVGVDKNTANAELDVDALSKIPDLNKTKYAIMHSSNEDNAIQEGEKITYVIEITNSGEAEASNLYVYDTVPEGTTLTQGTAVLYTVDNNKETEIAQAKVAGDLLSWKIDAIAAGETIRAKFDVVATLKDANGNKVTKIINTAIADGEEITPTVTTPVVTAAKTASLVDGENVTLLGDEDIVKVGQKIRYTITVTNTGDADGAITVSDTVPTGTEYVPDSLKDGNGDAVDAKFFEEGIVVNVPASGAASVSFDVIVSKNTNTTIKNVAKVGDKDDITDDEDGKKVANITTTKSSQGYDKENNKTNTLHELDTIEYTLTSVNTGDADGIVTIGDKVPVGTTITGSIKIEDKDGSREVEASEAKEAIENGIKVNVGAEGGSATVKFTVIINSFKEGDEGVTVNEETKSVSRKITNAEATQDGKKITEIDPEDEDDKKTEDDVEKEFVTITVNKKWTEPAGLGESYRPEITFELYNAAGSKVASKKLNGESVVFSNLPKYVDDVLVTYTAKEVTDYSSETQYYKTAEDKTVTIAEDNTGSVTIENIFDEIKLTDTTVSITKVWEDKEDAEGLRPEATASIFTLKADGETANAQASVVDNNDGTWTVTYSGLQTYNSEKAIVYTVEESVVANYETNNNTVANGGTITNTLDWSKIVTDDENNQVIVKKIWNDAEQGTENTGNGQTLVDLWKGSHWFGNGLGNTLSEEAKAVIKAYLEKTTGHSDIELELTYRGPTSTLVRVVYSYEREVRILGIKTTVRELRMEFLPRFMVVEEADSSLIVETMRPETLTVNVMPEESEVNVDDDAKITDTVELTATEDWQKAVEGLRIYDDDGNKISYKVEEVVPDKYEIESVDKTVTEDGKKTTFTITNKIEEEEVSTTDIVAKKIWKDNDNAEGLRPGSVEVTLYANGESTDKKLTLSESNGWTDKFEALPTADANKEIIAYTVVEENVAEHYIATTDIEVPQEGATAITYNITNTLKWEEVKAANTVKITKNWEAPEGLADSYKPEVTFTLTTSDIENFEPVTISLNGTTAPVFENLRKYNDAGEVVTYTITENVTSEDYFAKDSTPKTVTFEDNEEATVSFTNTFKPETITNTTVSITKVWEDNENAEGLRPEATASIFTLKADGEAANAQASVVDNNDGTWTVMYRGLQTYNSERAIDYTVEEAEVEHYRTGNNTASNGGTITNTLKWEKLTTSVPVEKVWDDNNNANGRRTNITLALTANNMQLEENPKVELSSANKKGNDTNTWEYTFENLRKYDDNGNEIDYTIMEENVPEEYVMTSTEKINGKIVVTNSLPRLTVTKSVYNLNNGEPIATNGTIEVKSGDIVGYKITIQNTGNVDFKDIEVEDEMSTGGRVFETYEDAQNGRNSLSSTIVNGVELKKGEFIKSDDGSNYIIIYYVVTDEDVQDIENPITNTVTAKGYYKNTFILSDETYAEVGIKEDSRIIVSKEIISDKKSNLEPGDTLTYKITVDNPGNTVQENVIVKDEMNNNPSGNARNVTISSVKVNNVDRAYTQENGQINIGSLQWNETATIIVTYTIQESDMAETVQGITNTAKLVERTSENGSIVEASSEEAKTVEWKADISVNKTNTITRNSGNTGTVEPGDLVNYVIKAENNGRKSGTLIIKDTIPEYTKLSGNITVTDSNGEKTVSASELSAGVTVNISENGGEAKVEFSVEILANALGNTINNQATYINEKDEKYLTNNTQTQQVSKDITVEAKGEKVNYILAVDCSESMFAKKIDDGFIGFLFSESRYKVANRTINQFKDSVFDKNSNSRIQIVEYVGPKQSGKLAKTITSKNDSYSMTNETFGYLAGTDLYRGLEKVQSVISSNKSEDPNARNIVIVLSDGKQEDAIPWLVWDNEKYTHSDDKVVEKANEIKALGAQFYCIGFSDDADGGLLSRITSNCWLAKDGAATDAAFNSIVQKVEETREKRPLTSTVTVFDLKKYQLRETTSVVITYDGNESGEVFNFSSTGTNGPLTYSKDGNNNYNLKFDITNYANKNNLKIVYYLK